MNIMYSPINIDQTYFLIIYPNNIYMLFEGAKKGPEKEQPMYMGKDRIKLESILKKIKETADKRKTKNTRLLVYDLKENEIKLDPQSSFYNIIPSK